MLFPSLQFALFLTVLLALMFIFRRTGPRKLILLAASWLFYMAWNPHFIWLLLSTTLVDFYAGHWLFREPDARRRKLVLAVALTFNVGLLAYFKYAGLLSGSLLYLFRAAGLPIDWHIWDITLPIGISFYTFQSMSYTIDVYRRELEPTDNLLDYMLFVSFFPHLVAGPIVRAVDLLPQLRRRVQLRFDPQCLLLIGGGLVKKVLVADNLAPFVDDILRDPGAHTSLALYSALFAFSVLAYCDFSGYTDIAIGLARLFGYWFPPNFDRPLLATNPRDFWRRWHISLSSWLRDYVYVPLGGSQLGEALTARNLMLTMLLGGLWHGASWNFALWGGWQGLLLIGHRHYARLAQRLPALAGFGGTALGRALSWCLFTYSLLLSWLLFRLSDTSALLQALDKFFRLDGLRAIDSAPQVDKALVAGILVLFWAVHLLDARFNLVRRILALPQAWHYAYAAAVALLLAVFWPSRSVPFIYFQF